VRSHALAGMIHQCLLVAWSVVVISWFVWETWLRRVVVGEEHVGTDVDTHQPEQRTTCPGQVNRLLVLHVAEGQLQPRAF